MTIALFSFQIGSKVNQFSSLFAVGLKVYGVILKDYVVCFCVWCVILISEIFWATLFVYKHQSMLWIKSPLQYTCTYFICYIFNHTYFNIMNIYSILFKLYNFTFNYMYIPNSQFYCKIYVKDNIVIMDEM